MHATLLLLLLIAGSPDTLENDFLRVVITPEVSGVRAGSLLELLDKQSGVDLAGGRQFAGVQCGPFIPQDGQITHHSALHATFSSSGLVDYGSGDQLPIALTVDYVLEGRGLDVTAQLEFLEQTELMDPIEMDFSVEGYQQAGFGNQSTMPERELFLDGSHGTLRISGDQEVSLSGPEPQPSLFFVFPNPAKAFLALNDNSSGAFLSLRLFDTEPPRENCAGPDLHSMPPAGSASGYHLRLSLDPAFRTSCVSAHPDGFERTGAWILDEMPFIHPLQGYMWGYSVTPEGDEFVSAMLIQLLQDHPDLVMNWLLIGDLILPANSDSMWYEPGYQDSWSHWHCTWRVSTQSTPEYRQWLLNIHNDLYSWADRVRIGSHGYHHTPSPDSAGDPYHEFITYEPEEHMERLWMIQHDLLEIGFDSCETMQTIRFPGHRTSLSGLWAVIDYGFTFYCNGVRWWENMGGEPFWDQHITKFETPQGRIWGSNTAWWAAYDNQYPLEYLTSVMERGKHALLGCHPIAMWAGGNPDAYLWVDSICTSLEEDWSHFGWVFPSDYAAFLEECYQLRVDSIRSGPGWNRLYFTGSTSRGQYALSRIPTDATPDHVRVNCVPIPWELREGGRVFADVNGLGYGSHVLEVAWTPQGVSGGNGQQPDVELHFHNPVVNALTVEASGVETNSISLSLFDITGRLISRVPCRRADGFRSVLNTEDLPAGAYVLVAHGDERRLAARKITVLPR